MDEERVKEIAEDEAQNLTGEAVGGKATPETEDEGGSSEIRCVEEAPVEGEKQATGEDRCANIAPMADWVKGGSEEECRPCLLPPLFQWYQSELKGSGLTELADEIKASAETYDPVAIARKFDEIKEKVPDGLKQRLREFDCAAQLYKEIDGKKDNE